jgi:transcriptional enhancer factor
LTEAHSNGKLDGLNITDLASWRHEYPEFGFLQSETENWMRSGQKVLVCTASIQAMTEVRPDADLTIAFDLHSHLDLSRYDYLEYMTNFYDNGKSAVELEFDSTDRDKKERSTTCEYQPDSHGSNGVLRIDFGAVFWTVRMRQYQNMRHRDDRSVGDSLQHFTALQDIYGIVPGTGEARCLCTILWKFQQPRNSADVCSMEWHSISFAKCRPAAEERWCNEAKYQTEDLGDVEVEHQQITNVPTSTPTDTDLACYSTKPNWQHAHLISNLENAAEQYHPYIGPDNHMQRTQNHENSRGDDVYQQIIEMEESVATGLHDVHAQANYSLWGLQGLQSPFQKGSDSGSGSGLNYRKEQAHSSEFGVPDVVERN